MTKQLLIDQEEIKSLEQDQKRFLNKAITSYLKCLKGTDAHDLWVFRLVSLWFQNLADEETNIIIQVRFIFKKVINKQKLYYDHLVFLIFY